MQSRINAGKKSRARDRPRRADTLPWGSEVWKSSEIRRNRGRIYTLDWKGRRTFLAVQSPHAVSLNHLRVGVMRARVFAHAQLVQAGQTFLRAAFDGAVGREWIEKGTSPFQWREGSGLEGSLLLT